MKFVDRVARLHSDIGDARSLEFEGMRISAGPVGRAVLLNGKEVAPSKRNLNRFLMRWRRNIVKVGTGGMFEVERQKSLAPEDRKYFHPIIASGWVEDDPCLRFWVAQTFFPFRRAWWLYSNEDWGRGWERIEPLKKRYGVKCLFLLRDSDSGKLFGYNWTLIDGAPVVHDYEA